MCRLSRDKRVKNRFLIVRKINICVGQIAPQCWKHVELFYFKTFFVHWRIRKDNLNDIHLILKIRAITFNSRMALRKFEPSYDFNL